MRFVQYVVLGFLVGILVDAGWFGSSFCISTLGSFGFDCLVFGIWVCGVVFLVLHLFGHLGGFYPVVWVLRRAVIVFVTVMGLLEYGKAQVSCIVLFPVRLLRMLVLTFRIVWFGWLELCAFLLSVCDVVGF